MIVQRILTINTGYSSLKVALYEMGREEMRIFSGEVERIGASERRPGHSGLYRKDWGARRSRAPAHL
jgi:acetate kinase